MAVWLLHHGCSRHGLRREGKEVNAHLAKVILVEGSRNDVDADPTKIEQQAALTLSTLKAAHPDARIVAIGPAWSSQMRQPGSLLRPRR